MPAAIRLNVVGGVDRKIKGLLQEHECVSVCLLGSAFGVVWEDSACVVTSFGVVS